MNKKILFLASGAILLLLFTGVNFKKYDKSERMLTAFNANSFIKSTKNEVDINKEIENYNIKEDNIRNTMDVILYDGNYKKVFLNKTIGENIDNNRNDDTDGDLIEDTQCFFTSDETDIFIEDANKYNMNDDTNDYKLNTDNINQIESSAPEIINEEYILENYPYIEGNYAATLRIPSININTKMVYGYTQELVDKYDVVLNTYYQPLGLHPLLRICGHNTKSLGNLHKVSVGDNIYIDSPYGTYEYEVILACVAINNDSWTDMISVDTGETLFTYDNDLLTIFTCYSQDNPYTSCETEYRFVVNAKLINKPDIVD